MSTEIFTGRVKWFNNKTGYGFITVTDGPRSGNDIFVHHSAINVEGQYKYLVQGEYVDFSITSSSSGKHECEAASVNGIKGGKLMCSTRHETNMARSAYKKTTVSKDDLEAKVASSDSKKDDGEWVRVKKTANAKPTDTPVADKKPRGRPPKTKTESK